MERAESILADTGANAATRAVCLVGGIVLTRHVVNMMDGPAVLDVPSRLVLPRTVEGNGNQWH